MIVYTCMCTLGAVCVYSDNWVSPIFKVVFFLGGGGGGHIPLFEV